MRVLTGIALGGRRFSPAVEKPTKVDNSLTPNPFVRGLVSYSGRGNHVNIARHARRLTRCSRRCVDYPVAPPARAGTTPLLSTERASRAWKNRETKKPKNPKLKKGEKKCPPCTKHSGRSLLNAHQFGTLVVANPDLLGSLVTNTEVEAFKEI